MIVLASIFYPTSTAYAHGISGNRDWSLATHDTLGISYVNAGNQVGFWQAFSVAYGIIPCASVDGYFGPLTANATKSLQAFFGKVQDGIVGDATWGAASAWMLSAGANPSLNLQYFTPVAANHYYPLYVYKANGPWRWEVPGVTSPFEQFHDSDHPAITFGSSC